MSQHVQESSTEVTDGVRIIVRSQYLAAHSLPLAKRYVFAYTVSIHNEGSAPVQLLSRHWIIADFTGRVEEVHGAGVNGEQPLLRPGEHFEYTSHAVLPCPRGEMRGSYQMHSFRGYKFDATIAPFLLAQPSSLN